LWKQCKDGSSGCREAVSHDAEKKVIIAFVGSGSWYAKTARAIDFDPVLVIAAITVIAKIPIPWD